MKKIMLTFALVIVSSVWNLSRASGSQISSLCDEWNVLAYYSSKWEPEDSVPYNEWYYRTRRYYLYADTMINSAHYTKVFYDNEYIGALRESEDAGKIFGVPANYTREYLIFDWSAQVGDTLQNYWLENTIYAYGLDITSVIVKSISNTNPRVFNIVICGYLKDNKEDSALYCGGIKVIEGIGNPSDGPLFFPRKSYHQVLCAYKNGEQVYTFDIGKKLGCYFDDRNIKRELAGRWKIYKETLSISNDTMTRDVDDGFLYEFTDSTLLITCPTCYSTPKVYGIRAWNGDIELWVKDFPKDTSITPHSYITIQNITRNEIEWIYYDNNTENNRVKHHQYLRRYPEEQSDTIPLYIKDGPGSSTVDPVDPNQIYATLTNDVLSVYELINEEIEFTLYKEPSTKQMPKSKRMIKATTFNDSISTVLTESGTYTIELTNPTWDYSIVGTFDFKVPQAVENTPANTPAATKILRDGQLLFLYKEQLYNVQGQRIQ